MESPRPETRWQRGTISAIHPETRHAKTFRLRLERAMHHVAGQHLVIRLTAPDGYSAMRSYSIAWASDDGEEVDITVERIDDGEVSSHLHEVARVGDVVDVRGPIGRWFVWDGVTRALLIGGGSGVVPLVAMLRSARRTGRDDRVRLVLSVRTPDDVYYADELSNHPAATVLYTRQAPPGTSRRPGRIVEQDLPVADDATTMVFICGSNGFVESATAAALAVGYDRSRLRIERFGPSGIATSTATSTGAS